MRTYIESILGTYTPSGDTFGGADWTYIFGGIVFCLVLYFVLKTLCSLFK